MKVKVGPKTITFTTENEFETSALERYEGKKASIVVETYKSGGYFTTGFVRITFEDSPINMEKVNKQ